MKIKDEQTLLCLCKAVAYFMYSLNTQIDVTSTIYTYIRNPYQYYIKIIIYMQWNCQNLFPISYISLIRINVVLTKIKHSQTCRHRKKIRIFLWHYKHNFTKSRNWMYKSRGNLKFEIVFDPNLYIMSFHIVNILNQINFCGSK